MPHQPIPPESPWRWIARRLLDRTALAAYGIAAALLFPDVALQILLQVLHFAWFVIHVFIAWAELSIEHVVESAFGVHRHTAQIITAWIGLVILLGLLAWVRWKLAPRWRGMAPGDTSLADTASTDAIETRHG
jgi:hypothetical protein